MRRFLAAIFVSCGLTLWLGTATAWWQSVPQVSIGGAPPAYSGPGDVVSGAISWSGLRAYSSATKGNRAINACTPLDAACADLSTDVTTGNLTISLIGGLSCSVVVCTIKIFYDQTGGTNCGGSACDFTQATEVNRPTLIVNCLGSLPCADFSGSNSGIVNATGPSQSQPFWISSAGQDVNGNIGGTPVLFSFSVSCGVYFDGTSSGAATVYCGSNAVSTPLSVGSFHAIQWYLDGGAASAYIDGSNNVLGTAGVASLSGNLTIGDPSNTRDHMKIFEVGVWSGDKTASNSAMNSNQHSYWGF